MAERSIITVRAEGAAQQLYPANGETRTEPLGRRAHVEQVVTEALRKTIKEIVHLMCEYCMDDFKVTSGGNHVIQVKDGTFIRPRCASWPIWKQYPDVPRE